MTRTPHGAWSREFGVQGPLPEPVATIGSEGEVKAKRVTTR